MSQIFSSSTKIICLIIVLMIQMSSDFLSSPYASAQQETVNVSVCESNNCFQCSLQPGVQNECFELPGGNAFAIASCSYQNATCFHGVFSELSNDCSTASSNDFTNYSLACNSCFSPDGNTFFQVTCDAQTGDVYFANYTQGFDQSGCQGTLGVAQLMPAGVCTPIAGTIYHFKKMSSGFSAEVATLSEYQDSSCSQSVSVATMPIGICSDLGQIQCGAQITTVSPPPSSPSTTGSSSTSSTTSTTITTTTTATTTSMTAASTTAPTTTSTSAHQTTDSNSTTAVASTTTSPSQTSSTTTIIISTTSALPPTTTSTTAVASSTSATALSSSTSSTTTTSATAPSPTTSMATSSTAAPTSSTAPTTTTTSITAAPTTTTTTTGPTPSPAPSVDHKCPAAPGVRFVNNTFGPVYFDPSRITLSTISNMLSPTSSSVFQFSTCSAAPFPNSATTGCDSPTAYITQTDVSGTICLLQATLLVDNWAASPTQTYPNQVFTATYRSLESKVDVALSVVCNPSSDSNDLVALHSRYQVSPSSMGSGWQIYSLQLQSRVACLANNIPASSTPAPPPTQSPPPTSSTGGPSTQSPSNNNNNNNNNTGNSPDNNNNTEKLAIVIGAGAAGLAIMIGIFCFIKNRGKKPNHSQHFDPSFPDDKSLYPTTTTTTASGRKQNNHQHERTKVNSSGMSAASTDHNDMEAPLNDDSEEN